MGLFIYQSDGEIFSVEVNNKESLPTLNYVLKKADMEDTLCYFNHFII